MRPQRNRVTTTTAAAPIRVVVGSRVLPRHGHTDGGSGGGGDDDDNHNSSCTVHGSDPVTAASLYAAERYGDYCVVARPCSRPSASRMHAFFSCTSLPGPRVPRASAFDLFCFRAPPGTDGGEGGPLAPRKGRERYGPSIGCRPRDGCQLTWSPRLAHSAAAAHARPSLRRGRARVVHLNNTTRVRHVCQLRAFCDRFFFLLPPSRVFVGRLSVRFSVALSFYKKKKKLKQHK